MKARFVLATVVAACSVVAASQSVRGGGGYPDLGDTGGVNDGFPNRLSSLVGVDIRTGGHECFERVVLEFGGTGELPGYQVQYESDPILDSPSGEPVDVAGDATLVISFGAWMPDSDGNGYSGPREFIPGNVSNILEPQQIENFESQSAWAIGLDQQRGFVVSTLTDPIRSGSSSISNPAANQRRQLPRRRRAPHRHRFRRRAKPPQTRKRVAVGFKLFKHYPRSTQRGQPQLGASS